MSVCGYVSTKYGIVYGSDSQISPGSMFHDPFKKWFEFSDGSVLIGAGHVACFRKLCIELEAHNVDLDSIDFKNLLPATLENSVDAILIKKDGGLFFIDGPHGIYPLKKFGYYMIGSGCDNALGALYAYCRGLNTKDLTLKQAEQYLRSSLSTACVLNEYCSEPLFIETFTSHIAPKKKRA